MSILVIAMAFLAAPAPAVAAPKAGCPSPSSGWMESTTQHAAELFYPHLLPGQFESVAALEADIAATYDPDGDGVCIKLSWGDALNPNANWYGILVMSVKDNTAAAST